MEPNIKVFRAHRALAFLYGLLGIVCLAAALFGSGGMTNASLIVVLIFFAIIFSVHFFTARACRDGKPAGRIASIVIACLMLFGFPVGTLIGIYLLVNTWKPWTVSPPPLQRVPA